MPGDNAGTEVFRARFKAIRRALGRMTEEERIKAEFRKIDMQVKGKMSPIRAAIKRAVTSRAR